MIQTLALLAFLGLLVLGPITAMRIDAWVGDRQRRACAGRDEFCA